MLDLWSVTREAERDMMILGLEQLLDMEGWDRDSDALTSDVFGIIAQWYARGAGRDWLPGEAMELWTGGLVRWDDVQDGCLDLPGALLRWWGGGEHPGRMWSTRSARHAVGFRRQGAHEPCVPDVHIHI